MIELRKLADIRTGYPFRKSPERVEHGGCVLVQMRDLGSGDVLRSEGMERIGPPPDAQRQRLRAGDVVIVARGSQNPAAVFTGETGETAVAASNLMVLRPGERVLPEYLTWFLNLPETQERLGLKRVGSSVPFVSVQALSELGVAVPDLETQKRITEVYRLWLREQELIDEIKAKRRVLVNGLLQGRLGVEGG